MEKFLRFLLCLNLVGCGVPLRSQLPFRVVDYSPAPGQFVDYTEYLENGVSANGLSMGQVCEKLNAQMSALPLSYIVSLGGFGGEITVQLLSPLANGPGADFKVYGNAFYENGHTPALTSRPGGSAEPGVVWVSRDENRNGLPDDAWYEIAGSAYHDSNTVHNYTVTYYLGDSLNADIAWRDNLGVKGVIPRNAFHKQESYFPLWLSHDSVSFTGTRLAPNAEWIEDGYGSGKWLFYCYDWGYADNHPNNSDLSNIDIDWAVDADGKQVHLESIDFIKVVSALNQQLGGVGETSTEFTGVEPLMREAHNEYAVRENTDVKVWPNPCRGTLHVEFKDVLSVPLSVQLLDKTGRLVINAETKNAALTLDIGKIPAGIYFLKAGNYTEKVILLSR